jgi:hypothetical protein
MKIESFWGQGYRSLCDVRIENLGPFNVFYGPNGGGKSNILEGIRALMGLAQVAARGVAGLGRDLLGSYAAAGAEAVANGLIRRDDLCVYRAGIVVLGAQLTAEGGISLQSAMGPVTLPELRIEVTVNWAVKSQPLLKLTKLRAGNVDFLGFLETGTPPAWNFSSSLEPHLLHRDDHPFLVALLAEELPSRVYTHVSADRFPRTEMQQTKSDVDLVAWHLQNGRIKNALLAAQIGPSAHLRRRLESLRSLLAGEPLHRPPFDPIQDPNTGTVDLRERLREPNPAGLEVSIDLAGLGVAQMYSILAKAMLSGTRAVGIEEPEAHLHAPTSGRALRTLLVRLVEEKFVDQLFIATHSNLFDLDPTGYFDVSLKDGCTVVTRSDLTRIDREHLYEPGPAKHALEKLLQYAPEDEIVFRRSDGSGVTAKEMMRLLQEDDALAVRFLQDVHGAAVRMVKIQSKKSA